MATYNEQQTIVTGESRTFGSGDIFRGITDRAINNSGMVTTDDVLFEANDTTGLSSPLYGIVYNNGTFTSNTSTYRSNLASQGGALYNCAIASSKGDLFTQNAATDSQSGNGGGAVFNEGTFTSNTSTYLENKAQNGGGLINCKSKTATSTADVFSGNTVTENGGGVYNHGSFISNGSTYSANAAKHGGGLRNNNKDAVASSTGDTFEGNKASMDGGGVNNSGTFASSTNTFSGNSANNGNGGGVYNYDGTFTSSIDTFSGNSAKNGGGVYNSGTFTSSTNTFSGNSANNGGGLFNNANKIISSIADTFTANTAVNNGGGVNNVGSFTANTNSYSENSANNGGGVYNSGTFTSTKDTIAENTASAYGGGVHNNSGTFTSSTTTYSANSASSGGGGVYNKSIFISTQDSFSGNTSSTGGGIHNNGTFTSSTSTYSGNSATANGGAIYNYQGKTATSTADIFDKNTATNKGGAVYNGETATMYISGATFTENTAKEGGAIYNNNNGEYVGVVHVDGSTFATSSDTIKNNGQMYFSGTNTLNAVLDGRGLSHSEADAAVIKGAGTVGQTYAADGFETTFGAAASGMNINAAISGGGTASIADDAKLHFVNATMTTATKVYGAGIAAKNTSYTADSVAVDFTGTGMGAKALVCAGGKGAAGASIEVGSITVTSDASGDMGILYGGADLTNGGSFEAGTVTTTISGSGNYLSFVGNGCRYENTTADDTVTTNIGTSTVIISGGTFENLVYGGAYAAGDSVTCGTANLSISGGTFNFSVYGGNGGKSTAATAGGKSLVENVFVTIDVTGSNKVVFNRHLSSGSFGDGKVSGGTHITFKGDGANLTFGANSYVSGHSQNAYHFSANKIQTFVVGSSFLAFDSFTGEFKASLSNGFTNVSFSSDSSVIFNGAVESDLRYTSVWDFAVGGGTDALLNWGQATNAKNSFAGDTINLTIEDGFTGSKVLMDAGSDASLLTGWDKATVTLGGGTMTYDCTNKYYSDGSYKLYVDTTSGNNKLTLASLQS